MSKWDKLWEGDRLSYTHYSTQEYEEYIDWIKKVKAEGDKLYRKANQAEEHYLAMREFQERNANQARQIRQLKSETKICVVCGGVCV